MSQDSSVPEKLKAALGAWREVQEELRKLERTHNSVICDSNDWVNLLYEDLRLLGWTDLAAECLARSRTPTEAIRLFRHAEARAVDAQESPGDSVAIPDASGPEIAQTESKVAKALGFLVAHPDWTVRRIAKEAGCSDKYLSQVPEFKNARNAIRESGKCMLPRGTKSKDGDIEAWDDG